MMIERIELKPDGEIGILIHGVKTLKQQAYQKYSTGFHTKETDLIGEVLVSAFVPHGLKSIARKTGSIGQKNIKENIKTKWRKQGEHFLLECESIIKQMSLNTKNLSISGNSSILLRKFNRVRKIKNPLPFFDNLNIALQEFESLDLIWNKDIEQELIKRRDIKKIQNKEKEKLKLNSKDIIKNLQNFDLVGKSFITDLLKSYPLVLKSMIGALDRLQDNAPDAERHCITSCRASIELLCIELGKQKDWKYALNNIFPSETDRRQVKSVWNFLSGKGAHGGHDPTKKEAEYGFRLTMTTIYFIIHNSIKTI